MHTDAVHAGIGGGMAWSTVMDESVKVTSGEYALEMEIQIL